MMPWSPTVRRRAVSGLAKLWCRAEWRSSKYADEIKRLLMEMLIDRNPVNRLYAACVMPLLGDDDGARLDLIRQRLLAEQHSGVASHLMQCLARFRESSPDRVDSVVADVIAVEPWATAVQTKPQDGRDECVETLTGLVLYLALRWQTSAAARLTDDWFRHPTASEAARRSVSAIRPWLELGPDRIEERSRAFALLKFAATALEGRRTADHSDNDSVRDIHLCADSIVSDIYFTSGAHANDDKPHDHPSLGAQRRRSTS